MYIRCDHHKTDTGLLTSNGESWKEMRRYVHKTMTKFGFGRSSSLELRHEEEILSFFKYFDGRLSESGGIVQMQGMFNISVLNILWTMVASTRFDYESNEVKGLTELLEQLTKAINPKEMAFVVVPWLKYIPKVTGYSKIMGNNAKMQEYFKVRIFYVFSPDSYRYSSHDVVSIIIMLSCNLYDFPQKYFDCPYRG